MANIGYIVVRVDVIGADVPILIRLLDLNDKKQVIDYLNSRVEHNRQRCFILITYEHRHTFITLNPHEFYFTRFELKRSHFHFLHPPSDKLFNLLRRAYPDVTANLVKQMSYEI